jgi:hypothetical protein
VDVTYENRSQGTFVVPQTLLDASGGMDQFRGAARMPRPSGSARVEMRPWHRIRVVEFYSTDRFHNSASAQLVELYLTGTTTRTVANNSVDRLVTNDSRQQLDAYFDVTNSLTLHAGHRYQWGQATVRSSHYLSPAYEAGQLRRQVGMGGISYRWKSAVRASADFEGATTSRAYFRTSLRDYRKFHARASYTHQPSGAWRASFDYLWLDNDNPDPAVRWDFASQAASANFEWFPKGSKQMSFLADYTRSTLHSNIDFIAPQLFLTQRSSFREAGNAGTLLVRLQPAGWHAHPPGLSAGGTLYVNNGSRPTRYYVPQVRLTLPLYRHASANAEWRWYSMTERLYRFENFASHQLLVSLTIRQ